MQVLIRVEGDQSSLHLVPGPGDTGPPPPKAAICMILLAQVQSLIASAGGVSGQPAPEGRKIVLANAVPK